MRKITQITAAAMMFILGLVQATHAQEQLKIAWPDEYHWKLGSNKVSGKTRLVEIIPANETLTKWSILGTMISITNGKKVTVEEVMNEFFSETKRIAPQATLNMVEKGLKGGHAWILFAVQSPRYNNNPMPESQFYYVIQGNQTLYVNFVAVKKPVLNKTFIIKWAQVFKNNVLAQ